MRPIRAADLTVVSKRQMWLTRPRSRHRSIDGDWVLRPSHTFGFELIDRFKGHQWALWTVAPTDVLTAAPFKLTRAGGRGIERREVILAHDWVLGIN